MVYTKASLEALKDKVDLVEVIGAHVDFKRSGASFVGLCPFHDEKTPSFMIARGDKNYHCFGCGAHGDAIQFLTQYVKLPFGAAVENLAEKFHVKLEKVEGSEEAEGLPKGELKRALELSSEFYQFHLLYTQEGHEALRYMEERGFSIEFLKRFDIGWAPSQQGILKNWLNSKKVSNEIMMGAGLLNKGFKDFFSSRLMFPIKDASGSVIGFSGRKLKEEVFGGKYINTSETTLFKKSKVLFGLDQSRKRIAKERKALIVEGQLDCLRLIFAGLNMTVAGQGTAFGEGHARELIHLGVTEVYLALDADNAGREATIKIGHLFQKAGIEARVVELPKGEDPDSYLKKNGIDALLNLLEKAGGYLPFLLKEEGRGVDVKNPSAKAALVNKVAAQIKSWDHPLMVHETLRLLAELAQVPEEFLGLGEVQPSNLLVRKSSYAGSIEINPDRILEVELLRWLVLADTSDWINKVQTLLQANDLYNAVTKECYEALLKGDLTSLSFEAQQLMQELTSKPLPASKKDLLFLETLQKVVDRNWLRKREEIKIKIQSNRYSEEEVLSLVKEFDSLKPKTLTLG